MASRAFYGIEKTDKTVDYIFIKHGAFEECLDRLEEDYGTYETAAELIANGDSEIINDYHYDEGAETLDSVQEFLDLSKSILGIEMAFIFTNNKWECHETRNF